MINAKACIANGPTDSETVSRGKALKSRTRRPPSSPRRSPGCPIRPPGSPSRPSGSSSRPPCSLARSPGPSPRQETACPAGVEPLLLRLLLVTWSMGWQRHWAGQAGPGGLQAGPAGLQAGPAAAD